MEKLYKIGILGLGYVGLPLARLLSTKYAVVGFDINQKRVTEIMNGHDKTYEVSDKLLKEVLTSGSPSLGKAGLFCTSNEDDLKDCNVYIVTVPTPVNRHNKPDLDPLYKASETVGRTISKGDIVIYESTVYPGVTEDECVPVIEKVSGLVYNKDFFAGYSPERINPGDKKRSIEKITKVTSGSTPEIAKRVDEIYRSVIEKTHLTTSIKVAEAAKAIENSQRDINIAFVNELSKIFNIIGIDTKEVLEAAGTKWNFLNFTPGLVGGHCIGVDPYYLAQKAEEIGYHPEIILAGRRLNDSMGNYVASEVIKLMLKNDLKIKNADILVLGITFKENCPDVRNTRVVDVIKSLEEFETNVTICDPWVDIDEVKEELGYDAFKKAPKKQYEAIILAVAHNEFKDFDLEGNLKENGVVYDVKGFFDKNKVTRRL